MHPCGTITLVVVLSLGWLAERRIDRHALNILIRRVEAMRDRTDDERIKESCRKCLYHLDALYTRRGRVRPDDEIVLDSKDERRIILQAMGLAGIKEARAGFWKEAWAATKRWAWKKARSAVLHSLPWGVIATFLYFKFWRERKEVGRQHVALTAYDRDAEKLPQDVRIETFTNPLVQREHEKLKLA